MSLTPEVLWAQRSSATEPSKNVVFLTITVPDVPASQMSLDLTATGVKFNGTSDSLKKTYAVDLTLYAEIDPSQSKVNHTGKNIEIKLQKKELGEDYWPRLLKDKAKMHFLKTNFDLWVDEDEQDETADDDLSQFGGMGGMPDMGGMGGMPGMGGMGGMGGDFGGIDFSKLGGLPPMDGDDEDGSDDGDMPALEGEEEAAAVTTTPAVVEEVKGAAESK
ncbi:Protein wos2 [Ceratocystis lukuohia]|uniref:Protein wos2 n=3 Tax=Ceratocystis TaxID=5157 RepID=A0A0F8D3K5_CERFI|nr:Protein wos2 [Ceratocystis platani]PHH52427.1 Protein wos2 [Ceratocystis fimbriata CBS 114723]